jgi:hypothetical protein
MTRLWQSVIGGAVVPAAVSGSASSMPPRPSAACPLPPAARETITCVSGRQYLCRFQRNARCQVIKQCGVVPGAC